MGRTSCAIRHPIALRKSGAGERGAAGGRGAPRPRRGSASGVYPCTSRHRRHWARGGAKEC
eukprot:5007784-Prymnesium_polylepis.1